MHKRRGSRGVCVDAASPLLLSPLSPSPYFDFPFYDSHRNTFGSCHIDHMFLLGVGGWTCIWPPSVCNFNPTEHRWRALRPLNDLFDFCPHFLWPAGQQHHITPALKQPTPRRIREGNGRHVKLCRTPSTSHSTCWADKRICCEKINKSTFKSNAQ